MKLSIDKKYKTIQEGYPVRILCTDRIDPNGYTATGLVYLDCKEHTMCFSPEGKSSSSIYYDLVEVLPFDDYKIDDLVLVSEDTNQWYKRHFAGVTLCGYGHAKTWQGGQTSWTTDQFECWKFCRKPEKIQ